MSDLDEKLKDIVIGVINDGMISGRDFIQRGGISSTVADIKQAFTDAGYVQVPLEVQDTWRDYNRMAGYMTGQDWYDRFKDTVNTVETANPTFTEEYYLKLAKRAAGIDKD